MSLLLLEEETHGTHMKAWGRPEAWSTLNYTVKLNETGAIETFPTFVARWVQ